MTLRELSREHTGLESAPSYQTLRHRSGSEDWEGQRKAFRHNLSTQVAAQPTAAQVVQQTEQLVDNAEAIARHLQIAKSLQGSYAQIQKKLKELNVIEQMDYTQLNPLQLSLLLQRLAAIASTAAEIERKALGLSDPEQRVKVDVSGGIDFSALPDEELRRIAASN